MARGKLAGTVRTLVDATPPSRDRYVDFLRALAILAVVCGHWLVATITRTDPDGPITCPPSAP